MGMAFSGYVGYNLYCIDNTIWKKGLFMESKVKAIRAGSIIAIVSLFCFFIIGFTMEEGNLKNILFTIFSGIYTSSFVTILIYATEYHVAKKEAMEEYWNASFTANQMIMKIPFLAFDEPDELIKEYFAEIAYNKVMPLKKHTEAENRMIEYIRPQYEGLGIGKNEIDDIIRQSLKEKMDEYERKINKVMEYYIKIANFSCQPLEDTYGKLYFFNNQKIKKVFMRKYTIQ